MPLLRDARRAIPDGEEPGTALAAIASMGQSWIHFQVSIMKTHGIFTRYMEAMAEKRREADAKLSAERERHTRSINNTIRLCTVVIAIATVVSTIKALFGH